MQRPHREEPDEDRRECIADVENELLNEVGVKNNDAREESEQPHHP